MHVAVGIKHNWKQHKMDCHPPGNLKVNIPTLNTTLNGLMLRYNLHSIVNCNWCMSVIIIHLRWSSSLVTSQLPKHFM